MRFGMMTCPPKVVPAEELGFNPNKELEPDEKEAI